MTIVFTGIANFQQKKILSSMVEGLGGKVEFRRRAKKGEVALLAEASDIQLVKGSTDMDDLYGKLRDYKGLDCFVIHHPRGLLDNPDIFRSLASELERAIRFAKKEWVPPLPDYDSYTIGFMETLELCENDYIVALDIETDGLNPWKNEILTIGLSGKPGTGGAFDFTKLTRKGKKLLEMYLKDKMIIMHNHQFDQPFLGLHGVKVWTFRDTMFMHYLTDERKGTHGLKNLVYDYLGEYGIDVRKNRKVWDSGDEGKRSIMLYNAADVDGTIWLYKNLQKELEKIQITLLDGTLMPGASEFIRFYISGIKTSRDQLAFLKNKWEKIIAEKDVILKKYCPEDVNLNSVPQVKKILFDDLKLKKMSHKKKLSQKLIGEKIEEASKIAPPDSIDVWKSTSTIQTSKMTNDSTSGFMLHWLGLQHEFPLELARRRLIQKRMGAYHDGILKVLDEDDLLHIQYKMITTRTGRLSSSPSIHGIPKDKDIKKMFIARPGMTWIAADYSQAEVRMLAHFTNDSNLISSLEGDIHYNNMKKLFTLNDRDIDRMDPSRIQFLRRAAKTIKRNSENCRL